jgi:streptogramin lyase
MKTAKRSQKQRGGQTSPANTRISIFSGGAITRGYVNGNVSVARYNEPWGITRDSLGNIYIADKANNCIRRIDTTGNVTTFAGVQDHAANTAARIRVPVNPGYVNARGTAARLRRPQGIVCDSNNNLFFVETDNHVVRRIDPTGLVTTFAGPPATSSNSGGQTTRGFVNGASTAATFNQPFGIAIDSKNNLYVADNQNHAIRIIDPSGTVRTFAGGSSGNTDGTGTAARFRFPYAVVCDLSDNVFVADYMNGAIRRITPSGVVTTVTGGAGLGYVDGIKGTARLRPVGLTLGPNNTLFVADADPDKNAPALTAHRIRLVDIATGTVLTVAGNGIQTPGTTTTINSDNLLGTPLSNPTNMLWDTANKRLYVVNTGTLNPPNPNPFFGNYINIINLAGLTIPPTPSMAVTTFAGSGGTGFFMGSFANGVSSAARFNRPMGITVYNGNVYVADTSNSKIRMITPNGTVSTPVDSPLIKSPAALAFDVSGNMYIVNMGSHNILKCSNNTVTHFAGSTGGAAGTAINGTGSAARFDNPNGIAIDSSGNCIISDYVNNCLRKITPSGVVSTLATDVKSPTGIAIDSSGSIYVVNVVENTIIKVTPTGSKSIFAGDTMGGMTDGPVATAKFQYPRCIAIDSANNMYITDANNHSIRKIDSSGMVTTIAGDNTQGLVDTPIGPGLNAKFWMPFGIAVDRNNNNIFVTDWVNHRIRMIRPVTRFSF